VAMQKKERKSMEEKWTSVQQKKREKKRKRKRINDSPCSLTNIFQVQKRDSF
jgi:hypothetical protein